MSKENLNIQVSHEFRAKEILGKTGLTFFDSAHSHDKGSDKLSLKVYETKIPKRYELKSVGSIAQFNVAQDDSVKIIFGPDFKDIRTLQKASILLAFSELKKEHKGNVTVVCHHSLSLSTQFLLEVLNRG